MPYYFHRGRLHVFFLSHSRLFLCRFTDTDKLSKEFLKKSELLCIKKPNFRKYFNRGKYFTYINILDSRLAKCLLVHLPYGVEQTHIWIVNLYCNSSNVVIQLLGSCYLINYLPLKKLVFSIYFRSIRRKQVFFGNTKKFLER